MKSSLMVDFYLCSYFQVQLEKDTVKPYYRTLDEDKFSSPAPSFKPPTISYRADYLSIAEKDHSPSPTIIDRLRAKGNDKLAHLLEQAKTNAKHHAKTLDKAVIRKLKPSKRTAKQISYCEAHILSDAEFIRITRDMTVERDKHSLMPLVLANGGAQYLEQGYTLASAFDIVRREKQAKLHYRKVEVVKLNGRIFTPGIPTLIERYRKAQQSLVEEITEDQL
jgi:hypothetical protein